MNYKNIGMFCLGFFGSSFLIVPGMIISGMHPAMIAIYIMVEVALLMLAIRGYRRKVWNEWLALGIIISGVIKVGFMLTFGWCISMMTL